METENVLSKVSKMRHETCRIFLFDGLDYKHRQTVYLA